MESETVQAVPKGLATGRNAEPLRFGTIRRVIKFNFRNAATGKLLLNAHFPFSA